MTANPMSSLAQEIQVTLRFRAAQKLYRLAESLNGATETLVESRGCGREESGRCSIVYPTFSVEADVQYR
jgi:hypothetical protein